MGKLNEGIKAQIQKRNQLRDDFKAAENKYYELERAQRQARQEKASAERSAWADEKKQYDRQRKVDNLNNQPFTHEISIIEQTTKFIKSFLPKGAKETKHDNSDTHMVLASKKDRDDEFYFAPKTKGAKAKKESAKTSKQPIKHNAVTFKLFKELDLEAPITTEDIPATLEKLDAKLKYFQDKIKDWEASREEKKRKILAGDESDEEPAPKKEEEPAAEEAGDAE